MSLELFLERNAFLVPYARSPFSIAGVRKVHDVDIFDVVEELVHLFLPSHVVSPMIRSAKYVKGQCSLTANP